jgi:putative endonuclease
MAELTRKLAAERHGRRSERMAALLLMLKGYRILGRRVRTKLGELDLVALSPRGIVCFVEVKARGGGVRTAEESLGVRQRQRIERAAQLFLAKRPALQNRSVRFDLITVSSGGMPRHNKGAWRPGDA